MASTRFARLLLDPAVEHAMRDSNATLRLRLFLCATLGALLFVAVSWAAPVWGLITLMAEAESDGYAKRQMAKPRCGRRTRFGFLGRALALSAAWQGGPALMILTGDSRFFAPGLIWCASTLLFAAMSFRSPVYALTAAAPGLFMFAAAAGVAVARQGLVAGVLLGLMLALYCQFALQAAAVNHGRERDLRRTRVKLANEAQAVRKLAFNDQLTGLVNRRQLMQHLDQALAQADRSSEDVAVMLIDLDRFKFVNDTYGHGAGDDLLREVAVRMKQACRGGDVCARLGGDEFVVLAPGCGAQDAAHLAQAILRRLAEPVHLPGGVVHTAGSVGVSLYRGGLNGERDLLRQADLALYRVKENGRNGFCFFEPEMDLALRDRRGLEADLREALAAGDVGVVYQPLYEAGVMTGVEALARWTHRERGAIPPHFFVPLAEECGLIEALGMSVIRQAFKDSWRWALLKVSINLSPVQLKVPSFLNELQQLLEGSGVEADRIEFELTESILLADDLQTQHTLAALRALGFGITLDDFGTGYSSLSYLRKFPIDRIKIDRSFIASLPQDKVSEAVVRAVVRLGRSLGLKVVAEGVETQAQMEALSQAGCRGVQGFLTGPPMDAQAITETLEAQAVGLRAA